MSYASPTAQAAFVSPTSVQQFASEYGLSPFQIPNSRDTGYSGANPNAPGQYLYVGPDGQVYNDSQFGQETPGTPSVGNYQTYAQQNPSPSAAASGAASSVLNPSQIGALAPLPYQSFGNVPTITPTTSTAAQTDLSQLPGALESFAGQNAKALEPTFQAQDMALQDNLGSRGIVNSGAASYLDNQLKQGQASTLAGMDAPLTEQFAGLYGQAQLGNTANRQQTSLANQEAGNTANALNAGYYGNAVAGNQAAYNGFLGNLFASGAGYGNNVLNGIAQSYAPANGQALATLGQSPGQVGAAYQAGGSGYNPAGFASGVNAIENAFTQGGNPGGSQGAFETDLQGDGSILNPGASATYK